MRVFYYFEGLDYPNYLFSALSQNDSIDIINMKQPSLHCGTTVPLSRDDCFIIVERTFHFHTTTITTRRKCDFYFLYCCLVKVFSKSTSFVEAERKT